MADQLRWWKLWASVLTDEKIRGLRLDDVGRWCLLGVWLRLHGTDGRATVPYPARSLIGSLRVGVRGGALRGSVRSSYDTLVTILRRLPNVGVEVEGEIPDQTLTVWMRNWRKYQEDSSVQRTRKWREKQRSGDGSQGVTRDDQPTSHVTVQTRRDETRTPYPLSGEPSQQNGRPKYPPELFRHDSPCAVVAETGRPWPPGTCVNRAWLDAHPEVMASERYPAMRDPDRPGEYMPKTCEAHR